MLKMSRKWNHLRSPTSVHLVPICCGCAHVAMPFRLRIGLMSIRINTPNCRWDNAFFSLKNFGTARSQTANERLHKSSFVSFWYKSGRGHWGWNKVKLLPPIEMLSWSLFWKCKILKESWQVNKRNLALTCCCAIIFSECLKRSKCGMHEKQKFPRCTSALFSTLLDTLLQSSMCHFKYRLR